MEIYVSYIPSNAFGGLTSHLGGDVEFCTPTIHNLAFGNELPGWNIATSVSTVHIGSYADILLVAYKKEVDMPTSVARR